MARLVLCFLSDARTVETSRNNLGESWSPEMRDRLLLAQRLRVLSRGIFKTGLKGGFRAQESPGFKSMSGPAVLLIILSLL